MAHVPLSAAWIDGSPGFLRLIDQTLLPNRLEYRDCKTVEDVWEAIRSLRVRGAPAIGIAAAYGVVVGVQSVRNGSTSAFAAKVAEVAAYLRTSRPTAVNLFWALDRMEAVGRSQTQAAGEWCQALLNEAHAIRAEDAEMCHAIGRFGADLIGMGDGVLTHCNTGGLATAEYGTALAVLFTAHDQGKNIHVFADETRPLLQGARLTAWELAQHGVKATLICDNMAAQVMKEGKVQHVIVGADRIAANGDAANKIGTYGLAVLAKHHGIPFYVAAPSTTFDFNLADGSGIPIEQRNSREITHGFGSCTAPEGVVVYNPAFDVTPAELTSALITEKGVIRPVNEGNIRRVLRREDSR